MFQGLRQSTTETKGSRTFDPRMLITNFRSTFAAAGIRQIATGTAGHQKSHNGLTIAHDKHNSMFAKCRTHDFTQTQYGGYAKKMNPCDQNLNPPTQCWLVLDHSVFFRQLLRTLHQHQADSACLVVPHPKIPPHRVHYQATPYPVLFYDDSQREDSQVFLFQWLSTLSGPWRGIVTSSQSSALFLAAYLARYLALPLIVKLSEPSQTPPPELAWVLQSPKLWAILEHALPSKIGLPPESLSPDQILCFPSSSPEESLRAWQDLMLKDPCEF